MVHAAASVRLQSLILMALILGPRMAAGQALTITNGVQIYISLTNTTVTMSNRCELRITATNNPIPGCTINLNSSNAWFILSNIRPSAVLASYLSQVFVNGTAAVAGSNCRVDPYVMGTVIIPQSPSITPLQIFSGPNFLGTSMQLGLYTYYTNTALGALNRNIGSFKLKRGYSATFAQNSDGSGASEVFVAQDGDLEVGMLAASLNRPISFVRVFPWRWTGKRGWDDTAGDSAIIKPLWFYDWGSGRTSDTDAEYAPMQWGGGYSSGINSKQKSTEVLGFNEPDSASQANLTVAAAIANWPSLMQSGLRVGAPAVSDSGVSGQGLDWLYGFMSQATNLGYRVDFIPIHWYKCGQSATQLSNYLASVYQRAGRPIWLTEFNYGANWCDVNGSLPPTPSQEATAVSQFLYVLENAPFVERYSIYNWVTTNREMVLDNGTLTPAGVIYVNQQSAMAYTQTLPPGGSRSIAQFQFETNTLDSSGYGNNGFAVGIPGYTTGHSGQAVTLDGTNSFLQLPPNVANSSVFSFAAWVYWNGGAIFQRIFDFGNDTTHYLFLTPNSGSTLRFAIRNGGAEQIIETTAIPAGQWWHVAVTVSGSSAKLYTNGVLAASSSSITISPANFGPARNYLGKSQFPVDPLFSGNLDEVQIADYAFTAAQIASLLTNSPPQFTTNLLDRGTAAPFVAFGTNITGTATDPDPGDALTYSKASGPAWLTVNSDGTLTGTPGSGDGGTNYFTVRAADTTGASAFAVVSVIVPINYASGTWTADAGGDWSDTSKWSGGVIANGGNGANYTADFSTLNITADRTVNLDTSRRIGALKFGDTSGAQNWLMTSGDGTALTLDTGSTTVPSIVVSQNAATIAAPLAGVNGFGKTGSGTLVLSNANSFSGTLNVDTAQGSAGNDGVVRLAAPNAAGSISAINIRNQNSAFSTLQTDGTAGGVNVTAGLLLNGRNNTTPGFQNIAGTNTFTGNLTFGSGGGTYLFQSDAGSLVFSGVLGIHSLTSGRTLTFQGTGDFLVSGSITNGSIVTNINSVVKSGLGRLALAGTNTYFGTTTVNAGTLLVNGLISTGAVTVAGTATLGGNGRIKGVVTIQSGGTLAPGINSSLVGTLTVSNSVTLQAGSITRIKISKTPLTNDVLRVTGAAGTLLTYGGTLTVSNLNAPPTAGDSFKIFQAAAYNGTFAALNPPAPGTGLAWNTTSLTNGVLSVVAAVPPQFGSLAQMNDGNFQLGGSGAAGVTYELDAATDLTPPIAWSFVTNAVADQNGLFQFADLQATNFPQRFYRILSNQ